MMPEPPLSWLLTTLYMQRVGCIIHLFDGHMVMENVKVMV